MDKVKVVLFFLLSPITIALVAFVMFTYGKDKDTQGWFQKMWGEGGFFTKLLLLPIAPFIFIPVFALRFGYEAWEELLD